jgi:Fe-S cluster assembly ATP-binding protein
MASPVLQINGLVVSVDGKIIISGLDLTIRGGEVHVIMGPNGTGKSTLASTLMGHPKYKVVSGSVTLDGEDLLGKSVTERARAGLFLALQHPPEVSGVSNLNFLRAALNTRRAKEDEISAIQFVAQLYRKMVNLNMGTEFAERYLNEGFSGGEKKRNEMLQLAVLEPRIAILDEIDSGLDIDALKIVAENTNSLRSPDRGFLIVTHYQRLLQYIVPDFVHVMMQGRIVRSGGKELAMQLEASGYDWLRKELGIEEPVEVNG